MIVFTAENSRQCCCIHFHSYHASYFTGNSQEDSVVVVLHQQPAGRVHQSVVCELLQPCLVPCSQLTSPGALGWLLHPLEPSHETSGELKSLFFFNLSFFLCVCTILMLWSSHINVSFTQKCLSSWAGTCSPALQGAAGQAC